MGRTAVSVTELAFGGAPVGSLGRVVDDRTAADAIAAAWTAGVRYFDTAPHYGLGLSERRIGAALAQHPRAQFVISTKVGRWLEPNPAPTGSDLESGGFAVPDDLRRRFDFSADGVRRSLDASMARLGVDHVDIVYVHDPDDHLDVALHEAIPALIALREQGIVGAVGVGMNQWQAPLRAVRETDVDVVMVAGRWTVLDRTGRALLDECAERGVSVAAAAPYNSGLAAEPWPADGAHFDYAPASPQLLARARALAETCRRHGVSLPDAAMQFPLRHPAVAAVVCGLRTAGQVRSTVDRLEVEIDRDAWDELDR